MKIRVTKRDHRAAEELIATIPPVKGEKRAVYKCADCGRLFGRRYIPFGIGHGLSVSLCMCQATAHRSSYLVLESEP